MIKQMKGLATGGTRVRMIPVARIEAGKYGARRSGEVGAEEPEAKEAMKALKDSIGRHGILVPLIVRPSEHGFGYALISGGRRLRAAAELGREAVPCIVLPADDRLCAEFALIDSMQRRELDMFEQAEAIGRLTGEVGLTREEAAAQLSCTVGCVSNKLRLLRLSERERGIIRRAGLSERHARAALRIHDPDARLNAIREMAGKGMTVCAAEELVERIVASSIGAPVPAPRSTRDERIEQIRAAFPAVHADRQGGAEQFDAGVRILANTLEASAKTLRKAGLAVSVERGTAAGTVASSTFTVTVSANRSACCLPKG